MLIAPLLLLAVQAERPNLVVIVADDLGWTDLACQGSGYYETPRIDALAASGVTFTDAYASPNCAPTRATLLTGRYPARHGVYTVGKGARGKREHRALESAPNRTELALDEVTFAEVLRAAGYATAHVGKWHLGQDETGPTAQGFDVNVGGYRKGHPKRYVPPYENPALADGPAGEHLTERLANEAADWIGAHADGPFLLHMSFYAVHTPLQPPARVAAYYSEKEPSGGHELPVYAAMVAALDAGVGRVLDALAEHGLADSTYVVFVSDNGGVGGYAAAGVEGMRGVTSNAPLRGGKGMLYEGGVRVPMFVRGPGAPAGGRCAVPVGVVDLLPTLCALAGVDAPANVELDGVDVSGLVRDPAAALERDALFWHFPGYLEASVKQGTWRTTPASALRAGRYKLLEFFEDGRLELYDVVADPGETTDLAAREPERVSALHRSLVAWRARVGATIPEPLVPAGSGR